MSEFDDRLAALETKLGILSPPEGARCDFFSSLVHAQLEFGNLCTAISGKIAYHPLFTITQSNYAELRLDYDLLRGRTCGLSMIAKWSDAGNAVENVRVDVAFSNNGGLFLRSAKHKQILVPGRLRFKPTWLNANAPGWLFRRQSLTSTEMAEKILLEFVGFCADVDAMWQEPWTFWWEMPTPSEISTDPFTRSTQQKVPVRRPKISRRRPTPA